MTKRNISHSKSYGLTLADVARYFNFSSRGDYTLLAAKGLIMAYLALSALEQESKYIKAFKSCLERAWRVLLYLRSKQPTETLDESIFTRYGRFRGVLSVKTPDLDVIEEDVEVEGVKRPICRPKVRKRRRKIRGK